MLKRLVYGLMILLGGLRGMGAIVAFTREITSDGPVDPKEVVRRIY